MKSTNRTFKLFLGIIFLAVIGACSSSGESDLAPNESKVRDNETGYELTIRLVKESDGTATTSITSAEPGVLAIEYNSPGNTPVASAIIVLTTELGDLVPSVDGGGTSTALTDENGRAQVRLTPGDISGAGFVFVSAQIPGSEKILETTLNYAVGDIVVEDPNAEIENVYSISLAFSSEATEINTIRIDAPGTLTATILDPSNNPAAGELITFSSPDLTLSPANGQVISDENGLATIEILAGSYLGVSSVTASMEFDDEEFTDSINVTAAAINAVSLPANEVQAIDPGSGYTLHVALVRESDGVATTLVTAEEPGTLIATYTAPGAAPVVSSVINFLGIFAAVSPSIDDGSSGTALTDAEGKARIRVLPSDVAGAGSVSVSAAVPNSSIPLRVDLNFAIDGVGQDLEEDDIVINLSITSDAEEPNTIHSDAPGTLSVSVLDTEGNAIPNRIVSFSAPNVSFNPSAGEILTDAEGNGSIQVLANSYVGIAPITASIQHGEDEITQQLNIIVDEVEQVSLPANEGQAIDPGTGYTLHVELLRESDNTDTTLITSAEPGIAIATYTDSDGAAVQSAIITFSSAIAAISPATGEGEGNGLTNSEGKTQVRIIPAGVEGATTLTVRAIIPNSNNNELTAQLNYEIDAADTGPNEDISIQLSLTSDVEEDNTIRADAPGTITAIVRDADGDPVPNAIVQFSNSILSFNPSSGLSLTNSEGIATIQVLANDSVGATTITVQIDDNSETYRETINLQVDPPTTQLGSGTDDSFTPNVLALTVNPLSAGGTTTVSANIVDENNELYTAPVTVNFESPCANEDLATIDDSVTTSSGLATSIYRATGCVGSDVISATLEFGGELFTATTTLTIAEDSAGAIAFVNASPDTIVLKGAGGQEMVESSLVSFQVLGGQGLPLANQTVNFSLTTSVGGIQFTPASAVSDSDGMVSTTVQSGSISTSVVVIATLADSNISTQSGLLVISTGLPDQDSMTLAPSCASPEAWSYIGEQVSLTAYAADQFNNPVPDGVQLYFTTEGGIVDPACTTVNGSCTVTWSSQNPKPADGRATIMVSAIGQESYQDENGNGVFDDGDTFDDLSEAFRDDDEDKSRGAGEPYVDFNVNGSFDTADGLYGGPSCEHSTLCSTVDGSTVSDDIIIIFSGSDPLANYDVDPADYTIGGTINATFSDERGNSLPCGTTINATVDNGILLGADNYTISNAQIESVTLPYNLQSDGESSIGALTITVTTPKGHVTEFNYVFVD